MSSLAVWLTGLASAGVIVGGVWRIIIRPAVRAVNRFVVATQENTQALHSLSVRVSRLEHTTRKANNGHAG